VSGKLKNATSQNPKDRQRLGALCIGPSQPSVRFWSPPCRTWTLFPAQVFAKSCQMSHIIGDEFGTYFALGME
jgi:hypothetical protein